MKEVFVGFRLSEKDYDKLRKEAFDKNTKIAPYVKSIVLNRNKSAVSMKTIYKKVNNIEKGIKEINGKIK